MGSSGQAPGGCGPGVLSVSVRVDEESSLGQKLHTHRMSQIQALRSPPSFRAPGASQEISGEVPGHSTLLAGDSARGTPTPGVLSCPSQH